MGKTSTVKKTVIRSAELECDGSVYNYSLIKKESKRIARYIVPLYSIEVKMIDSEGKSTRGYASDLFADLGKALVFYEKLVRNVATPIDLGYVVEDDMAI